MTSILLIFLFGMVNTSLLYDGTTTSPVLTHVKLKPFKDYWHNSLIVKDAKIINGGSVIKKGTIIMVSYPVLIHFTGKITFEGNNLAEQIFYLYSNHDKYGNILEHFNDIKIDRKVDIQEISRKIPNYHQVLKKFKDVVKPAKFEHAVKVLVRYCNKNDGFIGYYGYSHLLNGINGFNVETTILMRDNDLELNVLRPRVSKAIKDIPSNGVLIGTGNDILLHALEEDLHNIPVNDLEGYFEEMKQIHPKMEINLILASVTIVYHVTRVNVYKPDSLELNAEYFHGILNEYSDVYIKYGYKALQSNIKHDGQKDILWFCFFDFVDQVTSKHWKYLVKYLYSKLNANKDKIEFLFEHLEKDGLELIPSITSNINGDEGVANLAILMFTTYYLHTDIRGEFYGKEWKALIQEKRYYDFLVKIATVNLNKYNTRISFEVEKEEANSNGQNILGYLYDTVKRMFGCEKRRTTDSNAATVNDDEDVRKYLISYYISLNALATAVLVGGESATAIEMFVEGIIVLPPGQNNIIGSWFQDNEAFKAQLASKIINSNADKGIKYYYVSAVVHHLEWHQTLNYLLNENILDQKKEYKMIFMIGHLYFKANEYVPCYFHYHIMKVNLNFNPKIVRSIKSDNAWIMEYGYCALLANEIANLDLNNVDRDGLVNIFNKEGHRKFNREKDYRDSVYYYAVGVYIAFSVKIDINLKRNIGDIFGDIGKIYHDNERSDDAIALYSMAVQQEATNQEVYASALELYILEENKNFEGIRLFRQYIEPYCDGFKQEIRAKIFKITSIAFYRLNSKQYGQEFINKYNALTINPTQSPVTGNPTKIPTLVPTIYPTRSPVKQPTTKTPTEDPTPKPTKAPSKNPTTAIPTISPTVNPTNTPTIIPTESPIYSPTITPTDYPSRNFVMLPQNVMYTNRNIHIPIPFDYKSINGFTIQIIDSIGIILVIDGLPIYIPVNKLNEFRGKMHDIIYFYYEQMKEYDTDGIRKENTQIARQAMEATFNPVALNFFFNAALYCAKLNSWDVNIMFDQLLTELSRI